MTKQTQFSPRGSADPQNYKRRDDLAFAATRPVNTVGTSTETRLTRPRNGWVNPALPQQDGVAQEDRW